MADKSPFARRSKRPRGPSVRRSDSAKGRPGSLWLWVGLLVVAIVGAGWFLHDRHGSGSGSGQPEPGTMVETGTPLGDRSVRVVFPQWDGEGFVIEQRRLPSHDRPDEDLLAIMTSLCSGPTVSGSLSALPEGTRVLAAFMDPDDQSVVLDFSTELVTGHPGGSLAEVATLTSILRTVALNFPGTRSCMILIDGAPVGTLAGHLDMSRPFDPRRWL